ncbi:MAG: peroxiredoxin family protein [Limisphaerales bacterium]
MYPHERSLVKRLQDKPFVLLGVNSDPKDHLKQTIKKEQMTWRSWWDGGSSGGPIASQWGVHGWPTLYLIDRQGMIRSEFVGSPGDETLDQSIDDLLKEATLPKE